MSNTILLADEFGLIRGARLKGRRLHAAGQSYLRLKKMLDIALVVAAAPLWVPLFVACFLMVKAIDPKVSAFFVQPRTGRHGRRFHVIKFRSMMPDAHLLCAQLASLNERGSEHGTDFFKMRNDPRVTSVGRILRRYHLDELPQLINVLRGEMSLVGPRPTILQPGDYRLWQTERFEVPPGLTGLWQLHEDEFPSNDERMRLDIIYSRRCCLRLDIEIMLLTVQHVCAGRGC